MMRDMSRKTMKRSETGKLRTRKEEIEEKIEEAKLREKLKNGELDDLVEFYKPDD